MSEDTKNGGSDPANTQLYSSSRRAQSVAITTIGISSSADYSIEAATAPHTTIEQDVQNYCVFLDRVYRRMQAYQRLVQGWHGRGLVSDAEKYDWLDRGLHPMRGWTVAGW